MVIHSENATHRANMFAAEAVRQAAAVPGASQATLKAAEIAFARTCLASAKANNCGTSQFVDMLRELGTGGV